MDKRENLRNPDLLPFDYVSVLIEWQSNPSLVFRVVKVLKSSIPFNAEMLSIAGSNGNNTVNFTFQSPFDVLTSPWQFELEASFTAAAGRYRPTAVYNASNNLVVVKFPTLANVVPSGSFVVFTAKRYRPTTQYLQQLATASNSPVTIAAGSTVTEIPTQTRVSGSTGSTVYGYYFTAPSNFTITNIQRYNNLFFGTVLTWNVKILSLTLPLTTFTFSILFEQYLIPYNTANIAVSIPITTGTAVAVLVGADDPSIPGQYLAVGTVTAGNFNSTINGTAVTMLPIKQTPATPINQNTSIGIFSDPAIVSSVRLFYGGGATWSNIIY